MIKPYLSSKFSDITEECRGWILLLVLKYENLISIRLYINKNDIILLTSFFPSSALVQSYLI
jgi:hypothetical protein